jgi:DUF1680 family protein
MAVQPSPERTPVPRGRSSDPDTWRPVSLPGVVPVRGVTVEQCGLFDAAMSENAAYLLRSFSVDHMLYPFRKRAGEANPPGGENQIEFWDTLLEGSNAGRFLMGAGNTLRWREDAELRRRMDAVVDGIEARRTPEGFIHGFVAERMIGGDPGRSWGEAQRSNYARAWLTHGLIDAWLGGNAKALALARDWRRDDRVEFALPAVVRLRAYRGADNTQRAPRFALEYGPLLLAVIATPDPNPNASAPVSLPVEPDEMAEWLQPVPGEPLRWRIVWRNRREGTKERTVLPYWQVPSDTHFSCFPVFKGKTR